MMKAGMKTGVTRERLQRASTPRRRAGVLAAALALTQLGGAWVFGGHESPAAVVEIADGAQSADDVDATATATDAAAAAALDGVARLTDRLRQEWGDRVPLRELVRQSHRAIDAGDHERGAALARLARRIAGERDRDAPIEAVYNEGMALLAVGAVSEGRRLLERASGMPTDGARERGVAADASFHLGVLALAYADDEARLADVASLDPVARILEEDPERGWSDYDATIEFAARAYDEAARHFERVLKARPDDEGARRNVQVARLRAGELVRDRYEARREFDDLLSRIVRPEELIRRTTQLADAQGAAADESTGLLRELHRPTSEQASRLAADRLGQQVEINDATDALFKRAGLTRRVIDERVAPADPMLGPLLSALLEEFELGLRDAVESQRWAAFEFESGEMSEGAVLQRQAEQDLRAVLEKLQNAARNFNQQGQRAQQQRSQQEQQQRDERERRQQQRQGEEQFRADAQYEDARRDRTVRGILANEQDDLDRVRQSRRGGGRPVEKDW